MRRRAGWRQRVRGSATPTLKLTALMDIFSTLLLFLLKSFVAEGQSSTVTPGVTLPSSLSYVEPHEAPVVSVTSGFIAVDGKAVLESSEAVASGDLEVPALYEALSGLRQNLQDNPEFEPRIIVQGDRDIEFRLLQRVMYTSQLAGWTSVSLAVIYDSGEQIAAIEGETP